MTTLLAASLSRALLHLPFFLKSVAATRLIFPVFYTKKKPKIIKTKKLKEKNQMKT